MKFALVEPLSRKPTKMSPAIEDQTLAIASVFQSAQLIQKIAYEGAANQPAYESSMNTLFQFDSNTALDVFGDISSLITGFKSMTRLLKREKLEPQVLYYVRSLIVVAAQVMKDEAITHKITEGLSSIKLQSEQFELGRNNTSHKIDLLYQQTISTIKPRVMIKGDQQNLSNADNLSKIRTLLFAGVRAAVLWRQLGGSRWKLIFTMKKYLIQAEKNLQQLHVD